MDITEEQLERLADTLRVAGFESDPDEDNEQLAALAEAVLGAFDYDRLRAELAEIVAVLPGALYMDPPDGGDVPLAEQIRRMAAEVEALRSAATDFLREYYSRDACNSGPLAQSVERLKAALSGKEKV